MHIVGTELIKGKSAFGIPYVKMTGISITMRLLEKIRRWKELIQNIKIILISK